MKISFVYSYDEYEAINRSRRRLRRFAKLRNFVIALIVGSNFLVGFYLLWSRLTDGEALSWTDFINVGIGMLLLFMIFVLGPLQRRWYLRQQMVEGEVCDVEFDEIGLTTQLRENTVRTRWSGILHADEDKTHFLLWINKLQAYALPKSAFSKDQETGFRELLANNVQKRTSVT
ncbi:MAG: YcxB family protein [Rhizobiaceae bacterium]|nr:YcxB family protein [Rhizobiaceae bacterium]